MATLIKSHFFPWRSLFNPSHLINVLGLLLIAGFFISYLPLDVLNALPATGGDTGSHFWPVYALKHEGFPALRLWNPGHFGGQPLFVHYFPLPFILMGLMGFFMELGTAFNIGTLLPLFGLPFCVYFCVKQMGWQFPTPLLAAVFTLPYLYNESYSMFGGNTLSTLSGQFAHQYAICFLLLGIGFLMKNIEKNRVSFRAVCCFSAVCLSHAYVFFIIPVFFLSILFFIHKKQHWFETFKMLFITGLSTLFLSAWFLWPLIDDSQWATPVPMIWGKKALIQTALSQIFYPLYAVGLVCLISLLVIFLQKKIYLMRWRQLLFWLLPALAYLGMFFVFPKIGLADCRAVPQIVLFFSIAIGLLFADLQKISFPKNACLVMSLPSVLLMMWLTSNHIHQFPHWLKWNYSGWQNKKYYLDLQKLYQSFQPGFSRPRILFEHNARFNSATGSPRVFEMLPYFASRATLEGLYSQANLLSPESYYMQAKVSKAPSCPVTGYVCPQNVGIDLKPKLDLMGVGQIIAVTDEIKGKLRMLPYLTEDGPYGLWSVYRVKSPPQMIQPLSGTVDLIEKKEDWRYQMNKWFDQHKGQDHWQLVSYGPSVEDFKRAIQTNQQKDCQGQITVDFFGFDLQTNCVGIPHLLKFAYNSSWRNSANDDLYIMAPGMIGFIPSRSKIRFNFGQSLSWKIASGLSFLTLLWLVLLPLASFLRIRRKQ